jgi:hypothetical protein
MSLTIDASKVSAVLLADGWYEISDGSFKLDAYEFLSGGRTLLVAGSGKAGSELGFGFNCNGNYFRGPLTAVLAVRTAGERL